MTHAPQPLTIKFDKPGFFLTDVRLVVSLDGAPVHDGSFASGFEVTVQVPPGEHTLETHIDLGVFGRKRRSVLTLSPAAGWVASLSYSRLWGNFSKKVELRRVG